MKRHIYHYCATVQHKGSVYALDGIAQLVGSIETVDCYKQFKKLLEDNNENLRGGTFIVTSLSFLGMET
jgi:hypothetical protein